MALDALISQLGDEIEDAAEETFLLFSQTIPSQNLGIINDSTPSLDITISNHDFTLKQSPSILNSSRKGGTTGAVVWKVTPRFAEWLDSNNTSSTTTSTTSSTNQNILFKTGILSQTSTVLELGSGIAGIIPTLLSPKIHRYISTDQSYALKLLRENISANSIPKIGIGRQSKTPRRVKVESAQNIDVLSLDWETDDVSFLLKTNHAEEGVDVLVACDCIYNYALVKPFVQTCLDVCNLRRGQEEEEEETGGEAIRQNSSDGHDIQPTVCVIAQQLRQPDVFEEWLDEFGKFFRVWRIPDDFLTKDLGENSGFVVHVGVMR